MLTEIVLALGYNSIDKRLPANEIVHSQTRKDTETEHSRQKRKETKKQSTHNSSASHRTHSRPFSLASHKTHRVRTSKRIHIEHIESDQGKKKTSALTIEKKGKIEREYSQIETVQFIFCFFSYRRAMEVEVEEQ